MSATEPSIAPVVAIVLAAGASRRLGEPKQLLDWRGRPLLVHCLEQLINAGCDQLLIVLGAYAAQCQTACERWFEASSAPASANGQGFAAKRLMYGHNENWEAGQANSLNFGLRLVRELVPSPFHLLVALCDQPLLSSEDYRQLIEAVREDRCKISAVRYPEGAGAPACFHHRSQWLLSQAHGDWGAKAWIRKQPATEVKLLEFGDRVQDIDTIEQWTRLSQG